MKPNTKQVEAIKHKNGPLLIIAGAGSGKTTVLSHRTKYLLSEGVKPENILCVTFTNKAVNELKNRIVNQTGNEGEKVWVSTFHELSRSVIDMFGEKNISITHTSESQQMIKKIMVNVDGTRTSNGFFTPSKIKKVISTLKNELITVDLLEKKPVLNEFVDFGKFKEIMEDQVFQEERNMENFKVLVDIYKKYEKALKDKAKIDVDDMMLNAVKILTQNNMALKYFHDKYQYLMIDEYQDTNHAQYVLTKLLASGKKNIVAVGDDFQSIYKFRGSDMRNILSFDKDYPEAKIIKLEENYRSTKTILQAANEVIEKNRDQKKKELFTSHEVGEKIKLHEAVTSLEEAAFVAEEIKKLVKKGYEYRDIAVFYRNNIESNYFETVFPEKGIPYILTKESSFFERKEIKDILSYIKFSFNAEDEFSFRGSINYPRRGVGATSVERFIEKADGGDILSIVKNPEGIKLNKNATSGVYEFIDVIDKIKEYSIDSKISDLIAYVIEITKYKESYDELEFHLKKEKDDYLNHLIFLARGIEDENTGLTINEFLSSLSKSEIDDDIIEKDDFNKVNLLTVHSAKGMEFPVVFIVGVKEKGFPSKYAETKEAIEEERRLFYVALTRAKKELFISYPSTSQEKSEDNPKQKVEVKNEKSRFLNEFNQELLEFK